MCRQMLETEHVSSASKPLCPTNCDMTTSGSSYKHQWNHKKILPNRDSYQDILLENISSLSHCRHHFLKEKKLAKLHRNKKRTTTVLMNFFSYKIKIMGENFIFELLIGMKNWTRDSTSAISADRWFLAKDFSATSRRSENLFNIQYK